MALDTGTLPVAANNDEAKADFNTAMGKLDAAFPLNLTNGGTGVANIGKGDLIVGLSAGITSILSSSGATAGDVPTIQAGGSIAFQANTANKTVWLPAQVNQDIHGSHGKFATLDMADGVTHNAYGSWTPPNDFTSVVSLKFYWNTPATSQNAYLEFATSAIAAGEAVNTGGSSDSIVAAAYGSPATTNHLVITNITAAINDLTISAGDMIALQCTRLGGDDLDTLSAVMRAYGFVLVYI